MGIFNAIENSASGLMAQRFRLDLISNNIANANTTRSGVDELGNFIPYRRQTAVLQPNRNQATFSNVFNKTLNQIGQGVQVKRITEDQTAFPMEYNPDSPDAAKTPGGDVPVGYVRLPNVNIVNEMVDLISASRAYEANVTVINASKSMALKALDIGRG